MSHSIAEASAQTGLSIDTLRYYERDGLLLRPVPRSSTGQRRYDDEDVTWIVLITRLRATGMSIAEVRHYAELVRQGEGTQQERLDALRAHRERVLAQLEEVSGHLRAIDDKIALYAGRLDLERTPAR
ncbi:MerR family transcriptional regulator [Rhodococcus sp. Leaf7]|uniref:MerR family transcriptional regulator n=1 Tax=unclassified Rhodococcus (in: high G+C Gram-positive bacteria) TaxID=192944 RepID=UPI0006FFDD22|nr:MULTISPECIES: MerR family transcriptional regulator [unclassified Rhodococcus (in: high G+C Gram-positive bacteria)]KQU04087.1 MerR family transcriptional regulator [Rhodococcus sp. Leaf7]KQU40272.1 MerR family transcriptional regulator [Rhodococcus sp. Leaf247]